MESLEMILKDESGKSIVEYGLTFELIAIAAIAALDARTQDQGHL